MGIFKRKDQNCYNHLKIQDRYDRINLVFSCVNTLCPAVVPVFFLLWLKIRQYYFIHQIS